MNNFVVTSNQQQIKAWIESHQGKPVLFDFPEAEGDKSGVRIDFPGTQDEILLAEETETRELTWDEFFAELDKRKLVFTYKPEVGPEDDLIDCYRFELQETLQNQK